MGESLTTSAKRQSVDQQVVMDQQIVVISSDDQHRLGTAAALVSYIRPPVDILVECDISATGQSVLGECRRDYLAGVAHLLRRGATTFSRNRPPLAGRPRRSAPAEDVGCSPAAIADQALVAVLRPARHPRPACYKKSGEAWPALNAEIV